MSSSTTSATAAARTLCCITHAIAIFFLLWCHGTCHVKVCLEEDVPQVNHLLPKLTLVRLDSVRGISSEPAGAASPWDGFRSKYVALSLFHVLVVVPKAVLGRHRLLQAPEMPLVLVQGPGYMHGLAASQYRPGRQEDTERLWTSRDVQRAAITVDFVKGRSGCCPDAATWQGSTGARAG